MTNPTLGSPLYAQADSLEYQMHKKQQTRKKRNKSQPVTERFFRLNNGTTDGYEVGHRLIDSPIAKFDFEFQILGDATTDGTYIAQNVSSLLASREFQLFVIASTFQVVIGGELNSLATTPSNAMFRFKFDGADIMVYQDGVLVETFAATVGAVEETSATTTFGFRHDGSLSTYDFCITGVLADITFLESGFITNSYNIDDNKDIMVDKIGGEDGDVVNGNNEDWGLFYRNSAGWIGSDLDVPPWDSVNQELPLA